MFSRTSSEWLDFSTTTLLSLTAVCILRTLDWLLWATRQQQALSARSGVSEMGYDQHITLSRRKTDVKRKTYRFSHSLEKKRQDVDSESRHPG